MLCIRIWEISHGKPVIDSLWSTIHFFLPWHICMYVGITVSKKNQVSTKTNHRHDATEFFIHYNRWHFVNQKLKRPRARFIEYTIGNLKMLASNKVCMYFFCFFRTLHVPLNRLNVHMDRLLTWKLIFQFRIQ